MAITLYTLGDCPHCAALRRELDQRGDDYNLVDLRESPQAVAELLKLTGGKRVVPVLVDGVIIKIAPAGATEF